ncbi:hypothetical protein EV144_106267 [Flavobacterium sp. 270]|uniref:hypothetical protein n=1 Tax=Flavobacterium sp. 270 TaxID=2512114 RepID=UPI00106491A4|nr:hypothetical protein [Flavobacterium sp. 270]TDW46595.1 hypothetical protein EV144_106267 [Flavobacterium sp. 270]
MILFKKSTLTLLFVLSIISCKDNKIENKGQKVKPSVSVNKVSIVQKNDDLNNFIGEYEYKHPDTPNENLLLILKKVDIKTIPNFEGYSWKEKNAKGENVEMALAGIFYGNTDLFDDTREGYTPGYFVTNVQVEPLKNNLLKININLDPSDILESPIYSPIQSTEEALKSGNKIWEIAELQISRELIFEIKNSDEIILKSDLGLGNIEFKKRK